MAEHDFTNDRQLRLLRPADQPYEAADKGCKGLRVRITPSGKKIFRWVYREGGKQRVLTLGRYPALSLAQARLKLDQAKSKLESGVSPGPGQNHPQTVAALAELFYSKRILPIRSRPGTVRQVLDSDLIPNIGGRKLAHFRAPELGSLVDSVISRGSPSHAGRVLSVGRQLFAWGTARGYLDRDPVASLKPADFGIKTSQRHRALDVDSSGEAAPHLIEIPKMWWALEAHPLPVFKYALRLLLLSGCRSGELRLARWTDLDLDKAVWVIPPEHRKLLPAARRIARPWTVPLSTLAVEQFLELREHQSGEYVLQGKHDEPIHGQFLPRILAQWFKAKDSPLDIPKFVVHDLRRTCRTHLSRLGIPPHISESVLGHSLGSIIKTYDVSSYLNERRSALQKWADFIDRSLAHQKNIVELKRSEL